jgi:hypothetical protein
MQACPQCGHRHENHWTFQLLAIVFYALFIVFMLYAEVLPRTPYLIGICFFMVGLGVLAWDSLSAISNRSRGNPQRSAQ